MMRKRLFKQVMSIALCISMVIQPIPGNVLAAENTNAIEDMLDESAETDRSEEIISANEDDEATQVSENDVSNSVDDAEVKEVDEGAEIAAEPEKDTQENTDEKTEVVDEDASIETSLASVDDGQAALAARVILDDRRIDEAYLKDNPNVWRKLDSTELALVTTYVNPGIAGDIQNEVMKYIRVEVDNEIVEKLNDSLTYSWTRKTDGAQLGDAVPENVGEYELTISLSPEKVDGLYNSVESLKVSLTIEKADITVSFWYMDELLKDTDNPLGRYVNLLEDVEPGTTAAEFIEKINQNYRLVYKNRDYIVSRDILAISDAEKKLPINLFVLDDSKNRQPMDAADKFDIRKDYVLTLDAVSLTDNAVANYDLSVEDSYLLKIGQRQYTEVLYTRKGGEELISTYGGQKSWSVEEITSDIFAEEVKDASGKVTKPGAPTVFVVSSYDGKRTVLEGAEVQAKWYTRMHVDPAALPSVIPDEEAGELLLSDKGEYYLYTPLQQDPKEVGDYFIVWTYAGDEGAYKKSSSAPVKFTITAIPAVLMIDSSSVERLTFSDGMTAGQVRKAIAKITYDLYPLQKNETTGAMEVGTSKIPLTPTFFGTSYAGDDEQMAELYFAPEFVLQRRMKTVKEKGAEAVAVDERAVDWEEITGKVKVEIERKDFDDHAVILPLEYEDRIDIVESVTYEFRIYFTGNKVLHSVSGMPGNPVPITDVTTNAAERNYLIDIAPDTLDKNAVPVTVGQAQDVKIVTDAIVDAFIAGNADALLPQTEAGTSAEDIRALHQGTLESPATKIYDRKALFADRTSYKKADVYAVGADDTVGSKLSVSSTDTALSYDWFYATLEEYESYFKTYDEVQREYASFTDYTEDNPFWGWKGVTNPVDGTFDSFEAPGIYRLIIRFEDPDLTYKTAEAEVIFRVERQEIVIAVPEQYAKSGETIATLKARLGKENRKDFTIYKLPHNSREEFDAIEDETERQKYVLPQDDEIEAYIKEHGKKPDMELTGLSWKVQRKVKDAESGEDKEPAEWVEVDDSEYFMEDYTYGIAANWEGRIEWLDKDDAVYGDGEDDVEIIIGSGNLKYTTKDIKTLRLTGEEKHHEAVSAVIFYDKQLYVEVDADKIKSLSHEYDGNPVSLDDVVSALAFYTDKELTAESRLDSNGIVNTTDAYDPAKINIYWVRMDYDDDGNILNNPVYTTKNAVYGGTYALKLVFEGGAFGQATAEEADASVITYAPLDGKGWSMPDYHVYSGTDRIEYYTFMVTPHAITITPKLVADSAIIAGEMADNLLAEEIVTEGVIEKDLPYFSYAEIAAGSFDITVDGRNEDGTDKERFAYKYEVNKDGGYPAFQNGKARYIIQVDDKEIKDPSGEYLRFGRKYTVKLTNELAMPLAKSYNVTYLAAVATVDKRGNSEVEGNQFSGNGIGYTYNNGTYTVIPHGSVEFCYPGDSVTVYDRDGKPVVLKNTNIFGFRITVPKEFWNDFGKESQKFIYKNAIWDAGGYIWQDWTTGSGRYIDVVFPLTEKDKNKSFTILWEDGYAETFALADVVLEADLTKAVAPKTMKFASGTVKVAVGETQQLDLKLTKAQLGDVINVRYRIKGGATKNEYISLDPETGTVTGLKTGKKATVIEAYPVYRNEKGDFVQIAGSKGKKAKTATVKVTVKNISAAGVKQIVSNGSRAKLYFTVPNDGYRREIYVVDITKGTQYAGRKKWKAKQFDAAIRSIQNGQWEEAGFAIAPIYSYANNKKIDSLQAYEYDWKLKAHIETLQELEAGHEYLLYVRNVSAYRELDDGSVVSLATAGKIKKFKATKSRVQSLDLSFAVKTDENDRKNKVTHPLDEEGNVLVDEFMVELSAKKVQLNVYGLFSDRDGGNDAAEEFDQRRYSLVPTLKSEKSMLKKYQTPKLQYAVYDDDGVNTGKNAFRPGMKQSKYASVNAKGQVVLKGTDLNGKATVYIYVRDRLQHESWDYALNGEGAIIALTITASPSQMKGKAAKMKVGQTIRLADYVEYKDAKGKAIKNYRSCGLAITKEVLAAAKENGFEIVDIGDYENGGTHDWMVTAKKPNPSGYTLNVKDFDADGKEMSATVKLTVGNIDAIKGLKVTYVDDQYITVTFTHASNKPVNSDFPDNGNVYEYELQVKDARGNIVDTVILRKPNVVHDIDSVKAKDLKAMQSWLQMEDTFVGTHTVTGDDYVVTNLRGPIGYNYYTGTKVKAKDKIFAYTYTNKKLLRLSSYNISVKPIYEGYKASKAVTVKTKTKNLPASRENVDVTNPAGTYVNGLGRVKTGGRQIMIDRANTINAGSLTTTMQVTNPGALTTGNTYTLKLSGSSSVDSATGIDTSVVRDRVTDKLVWKSSNTKIAKVKAKTGTYTATLNALKKGKAVITVSSKLTKKVIARWVITVNAVSDGSSYGGKYEPTWDGGFYENILALYDPEYDGRLMVLSENVPLVINNNSYEYDGDKSASTWVSFTAPHYGGYVLRNADYGCYCNLGAICDCDEGCACDDSILTDKYTFYNSKNGDSILLSGSKTIFLEENQKVYFKVTSGKVSLLMHGTELARLTRDHTKDNPLDVKRGYVSFTAWEDNVYTFTLNGREIGNRGMRAGETRYIYANEDGRMYVSWRVPVTELAVSSNSTGTVELNKDEQVKYLGFNVNATGIYGFTYDDIDGVSVNITMANGTALTGTGSNTAGSKVTEAYSLKAGDRVVIEVVADPEITDAQKKYSVSVTVSNLDQRKKYSGESVTIPKGTSEIIEYVVPSYTIEKAQFRFKVTGEKGTAIEQYYDADYNALRGILADNTLITPYTYNRPYDGKTVIKAGSSIFIKVRAGGSADDKDAKDAELKVEQVPVEPFTSTPASKTIEVTNDTEQWYTFTASKEGIYEFGVSVADKAEGDRTAKHNASIRIGKVLFENDFVTGKIDSKYLLSMKGGECVAIKLNPGNVPNVIDKDGTEQIVKSSVTVTVNTVEVKPLALGAEENVDIPSTGDEVRYYSFTSVMKDDYTVTWKPSDDKTDHAVIAYAPSIEAFAAGAGTDIDGLEATVPIADGRTYYFKVRNNSKEYAVKGTLKVTAKYRNAELLAEGTPYTFELDDTDEKENGAEKVLRFVAPAKGTYAIAATVEKEGISGEPYEYPVIKINGVHYQYPTANVNDTYVNFEKGETKYIVLSFSGQAKEVKVTKGTFTISSIAKPLSGDSADVKLEEGYVAEYIYAIPEAGRYEFKADYDKEKAEVTWYETTGAGAVAVDGNYYLKNTILKAIVKGIDADEAASVKLYKPSKISMDTLDAGENKLSVKVDETKYYVLTCTENINYSFEISDYAAGKATANIWYAVNNGAWNYLTDGFARTFEKDDKLYIKVKSASKTKDMECKLTLTSVTELKLGSNSLNLKAGETKDLIYRAKEAGYYGFSVEKSGAELAFHDGDAWKTGSKFCKVRYFGAKGYWVYKLTNDGSSTVDLDVTMKSIAPVVIEPGSQSESLTLQVDEYAVYNLKTFKTANYNIHIMDTSKGEDLTIQSFTYKNGNTPSGIEKRVSDGRTIEAYLYNETVLVVRNDGLASTSVTVELTQAQEQPLTGEEITLSKKESRLVSFVAKEDNRYNITVDNKYVTMSYASATPISKKDTITAPSYVSYGKYAEVILKKGDKIVYRLAYDAEINDKNKPDTQRVNVKIEPVKLTPIMSESTSVKLGADDLKTIWYEFTAKDTAVYTFSCEDAYDNELSGMFTFYPYITAVNAMSVSDGEIYLKANAKVFVKVKYPGEGSYTLKYKASTTVMESGTEILDFAYPNERQEVKFIIPKGGTYKISAHSIRGEFMISARIGGRSLGTSDEYSTAPLIGNTGFLTKDDIVTIRVEASPNNSGKSSVTLRVDALDSAETIELSKEISGNSEDKDIYYEIRIPDDGLYALTASGAPTISYTVNGSGSVSVNGTVCAKFEKDDRVIIRVRGAATGSSKAYTLKIEKINPVSLDSNSAEDKALSVTSADGLYYEFKGEKAYIKCEIPAKSTYYYAIENVITGQVEQGDGMIVSPSGVLVAVVEDNSTSTSKRNKIEAPEEEKRNVLFTITNPNPEVDTVLFRFTLRAAAAQDTSINLDEVKSGTVAVGDPIVYKYKASSDGTYLISFKNSGAELNTSVGMTVISDLYRTVKLKQDDELTLTVSASSSSKAGIYELKITKLSPTALSLGKTEEGRLNKGETIYYEFKSTESSDDGSTLYQIYADDKNITYDVSLVSVTTDSEGNTTESAVELWEDDKLSGGFNKERSLRKDQKLVFRLTCSTAVNAGYRLTIKKVDYTELKAGTSVNGSLDAYERGYYEFKATDASTYKVSVIDEDGNDVTPSYVGVTKPDEEGKYSTSPSYVDLINGEISLKKDDKISFTVRYNVKAYNFTVLVDGAAALNYETLSLNTEKSGKLSENEKIGFEYTASDAAENGTLYSVYYEGAADCTYTLTWTEKDSEDKDVEQTRTGSFGQGSTERTLMKGAKLRFTIAGPGKYSLILKKVEYTPLTIGQTVARTLKARETVYYQYTSDVTDEKTKTRYLVAGSGDPIVISSETIHFDDEGKLVSDDRNDNGLGSYDLTKGQVIRFTVRNSSNSANKFELTVDKVSYKDLTLGQTVEGRIENNRSEYYQFTCKDDPAEGSQTTQYHVYGTASYSARIVTINEEDKTTTVDEQGRRSYYYLAKGQILQITVSGQYSYADGYNLTIVKYKENDLSIGSVTNTGKLGYRQIAVYTYKNKGEKAVEYSLSYPAKSKKNATFGASILPEGSSYTTTVSDLKRFVLQPGATLILTVMATQENDGVEFTVSEFKPETLSLGTLTSAKKVTADEPAYYQYKVSEDGDYIVTLVRSNTNTTQLEWRVDGNQSSSTYEKIAEINGLNKDEVLLIKVSAESGDCTVKLMLQKKPDAEKMTSIPWDGTLQPGEVKYLRFTIPESEQENNPGYIASLLGDGVQYRYNNGSWTSLTSAHPYYDQNVTGGFTVQLANTSMYNARSAKVGAQKKTPIAMGSYSGTIEPYERVYFVLPAALEDKKVDGETVQQFAPYYISVSENITSTPSSDLQTGMYVESNPSVVFFSNTTDKVCSYAFTLKDSWKDEFKSSTVKEYELEQAEAAYFTVTAPEDKTLFVTVNGSDTVRAYYGSEREENYISNNLNFDSLYGVEAGKTAYFKVRNYGSYGYFTFKVSAIEKVTLQPAVWSEIYIPADGTMPYEFTAPENGSYIVHMYDMYNLEGTYKDGEDDKVLSNDQEFEMKANEKLSLQIKNTSVSSTPCRVLIMNSRSRTIYWRSSENGSTVVPKDWKVTYEYTAPATGMYVVEVSGDIQKVGHTYQYQVGSGDMQFMSENPLLIELEKDSKLILSVENNDGRFTTKSCHVEITKMSSEEQVLGMGSYSGTVEAHAIKYFVLPAAISMDRFAPYYVSVADSICSITGIVTGMYLKDTSCLVTVTNPTDNVGSYAFELRSSWQDEITKEYEKEYTLSKREHAYFTVTAPEDKALYVKVTGDDAVDAYYTSERSDDALYTKLPIGSTHRVAEGKTLYFRVINGDSDDDADFTFGVAETAIMSLPLGEWSEAELLPGESVTYTFTAYSDGNYIIHVPALDNTSLEYRYLDGEEKKELKVDQEFELIAGETIVLQVKNIGTVSQKSQILVIEKPEIKTVDLSAGAVVMPDIPYYGEVVYQYTVPETGMYNISISGTILNGPYRSKYWVGNSDASSFDSSKLSLLLDEDSVLYINILNQDDIKLGWKSCSVQITKADEKPEIPSGWIEIDEAPFSEAYELSAQEAMYFAVTAPEDKTLYALIESADYLEGHYGRSASVEDGWLDSNMPFGVDAGSTMFFKVVNTNEVDPKSFTFRVQEITGINLELAVASRIYLAAGGNMTYEFVAPADGTYSAHFPENLTATYTVNGETGQILAADNELTLEKDDVLTFELYNQNSSYPIYCTVIVTEPFEKTITWVDSDSGTIQLPSYGKVIYEYTASMKGTYLIELSNGAYKAECKIDDGEIYTVMNGMKMMEISAGSKLYVYVENRDAYSNTCHLEISRLDDKTMTPMDPGTSEELSFSVYGDEYYLKVPISENGIYRITGEVDVDTYADFWVADISDEIKMNVWRNPASYLRSMETPMKHSGDVLYIKVYPYGASTDNAAQTYEESITITVEKKED